MARFRYPREASIIQLTDTVVELRIPKSKGFDYNPGQVSEAFFGRLLFRLLTSYSLTHVPSHKQPLPQIIVCQNRSSRFEYIPMASHHSLNVSCQVGTGILIGR